jgi:hypothetical protein
MNYTKYDYSTTTAYYTNKYQDDLQTNYWILFNKYDLKNEFWNTENQESWLDDISDHTTISDFFKHGSSNLWYAMFLDTVPNFFTLTDKFLDCNSQYVKKSNQCYDFETCKHYEDFKEKARELMESEIYTNCIDSHNGLECIFENSLEDLTKGFLVKIGKAFTKENKAKFLELVKDFCKIADR